MNAAADRGRLRGFAGVVALLAVLILPAIAGATLAPADGSPHSVGTNPLGLGVADFNDDGELDLVTSNGGSQDISLLLGDGEGGFSEASGSPFDPDHQSQRLEVGDINGDGVPDVVTITNGVSGVSAGTASVMLGDGAGGLQTSPCSPFAVSFLPVDVEIGDFNEDGDADLAIPNSFLSLGVDILLGNGTGCFTEHSGSPFEAGTTPRSIVATDFDEDGHLDLAVANQGSKDVSLLLGDGTGSFEASTTSPISLGGRFGEDAATGDFNEDGNVDLAVSNFTFFSTTVLLGDGDGGLANAAGSPLSLGALTQGGGLAIGDVNADGHQDIATAAFNEDTVVVHLGAGTGAFVAAPGSPFAVGDGPLRVVAADFNHDGRDDLASANTTSSDVTVLLGVPDAAPPTTTITRTPSGPNGNDGWYTTAVGVSVSASDSGTGVAETRCELDPSPVPTSFEELSATACPYLAPGTNVTADGEHSVHAASEDTAGNAETPVSTSFKIDRTPPTLTCPTPMPTFTVGSTGNVLTATVTDHGSGVVSSTAGAAASATSVGVQEVNVTGHDQAGNSAAESCAYLVAYKVFAFSPAAGSTWRGQTVPVRFALGDAFNARIPDAAAAALLSPTCRVKISATGAATQSPTCVKYDASTDQFVFSLKVGKGSTGATTLKVDVSYGTATASSTTTITLTR